MELLSAPLLARRRRRRRPRNPQRSPLLPGQRAASCPGVWRCCVRTVCSGLLVAVVSSPVLLGSDADGGRSLDPGLLQSLQQIGSAFRHGDAGGLARVLPRNSKVMVDLDSFSRPKAYYAPDQVILIFRKIFRNVRVIRFELEYDDLDPSGSELVYVPANWSVRSESSGIRDLRLQFTIRREAGAYYVRSIKEVN